MRVCAGAFAPQRNRPADPAAVALLAVSKATSGKSCDLTRPSVSAFGENYVQEASAKVREPGRSARHRWHPDRAAAIEQDARGGRNNALGAFGRSPKIAERLSAQRPHQDLPPLNICIQVNISGEASKSGVRAGRRGGAGESGQHLAGTSRARLMGMPEPGIGEDATRRQFAHAGAALRRGKTRNGHRYAVDGHVGRSSKSRWRPDRRWCVSAPRCSAPRPVNQQQDNSVKKICFVGGGNMASAMLAGLRREHPALACHVIEPYAPARENWPRMNVVVHEAACREAVADAAPWCWPSSRRCSGRRAPNCCHICRAN